MKKIILFVMLIACMSMAKCLEWKLTGYQVSGFLIIATYVHDKETINLNYRSEADLWLTVMYDTETKRICRQ